MILTSTTLPKRVEPLRSDHKNAAHQLLFTHSRWIGYEHDNFRGRQCLWDMSDRGEYNCYDKWCAQVDHISSVRAVKQVKGHT